MKHLIKLLVMALLLWSVCSCDDWIIKQMQHLRKENIVLDKMPVKTEIGANTFGCYINGKLMAIQGRRRIISEGATLDWYQLYSWVNGFWNTHEHSTYVMNFEFLTSTSRISFMLDTVFVGKNRCDIRKSDLMLYILLIKLLR